MTTLDWTVIGVYLAGLVAFAMLQVRKQQTLRDYYLASHRTRWWQSGLSTMATQLGAISFVSAPAFVAVKHGGGLKWLCYEFGVPLGILGAMIWIVPRLHRGGYISIYEFLEERFDRATRTLVSFLFQLGRALATAVSVLAGGIILSTATPLSTSEAILIIGGVTVLYDTLGGLRIVIASDVVQMLIIVSGIFVCGATALRIVGWQEAWSVLDPDRLRVLDFTRWGVREGGTYGFWPMTIGGMFLYASYYGCDQSQVQRELSVGTHHDVKRSLLLNAFGRFPVVLLYCIMGVLVGAVFTTPGLLGEVAARLGMEAPHVVTALEKDPDRMVPMFILAFLPAGVVGFVFVAILSALMSSLDSAINSLSAVTMEDYYRPLVRPGQTERHYLVVSKLLTVFWGVFCVLAALLFANTPSATRQTTIVLINAVGSLLYGPILAAFLVGIAFRFVTGLEVRLGAIAGIATNVLLWKLTDVSWLWWNAAGFLVALVAALALHLALTSTRRGLVATLLRPRLGASEPFDRTHLMVLLYFLAIVAVSYGIQQAG